MARPTGIAGLLALCTAGFAEAQALRVPQGTVLELMVLNEVSTRNAVAGTPVVLRLNQPLVVEGRVLLAVGAKALGEVTEAKGSEAAGGRGKMTARLTYLEANGRQLPITGDLSQIGTGGKSDDALRWVLAPFYAPFAPGNNAKLKAGQIVNGVLTTDYDVTFDEDGKAQFAPAAAPASTGPVS